MTAEGLDAEIMYQASIAPFAQLERNGVITPSDLRVISTILEAKYHPIFVHISSRKSVDNNAD